jgi:hypothetical protein
LSRLRFPRGHHQVGSFSISSIGIVELNRTARRISPLASQRAHQVSQLVTQIRVTSSILACAADTEPPLLRTLGAIHLSTALCTRVSLLVTYDSRMADAARLYDLPVASPGASG